MKITVDQNKVSEIKANEADANRRAAYAAEADPLFFKAQRGEATVQEWEDKVAEIKARFPKTKEEWQAKIADLEAKS
jgi:hypothetical protein